MDFNPPVLLHTTTKRLMDPSLRGTYQFLFEINGLEISKLHNFNGRFGVSEASRRTKAQQMRREIADKLNIDLDDIEFCSSISADTPFVK